MLATKLSKPYQKLFIGSSTSNQSSSKGTSKFWWLSHWKLQWLLPFASKPSQFHQFFSKNHQRIINDRAMKHQGFGDSHKKTIIIYLHRNHQGLINFSSRHQQRLVNQAANKHQSLKISTSKALMFDTNCIQIFVVSSINLQSVLNESSMTEQWNMKDSETATKKTINKNCIEIIKVSSTSLQGIIND